MSKQYNFNYTAPAYPLKEPDNGIYDTATLPAPASVNAVTVTDSGQLTATGTNETITPRDGVTLAPG